MSDEAVWDRCLCLSVDVQGYGTRDDVAQGEIQRVLVDMLDTAGARAGVDRHRWRCQPKGDEELALIPDAMAQRVVGEFCLELAAVLRRYNLQTGCAGRLRLRVAFDEGPVQKAANGFAGHAVVGTSRLVNSLAARQALQFAPDTDLVVVLSQRVYDDWVASGRGAFKSDQFRRVRVREKEVDEDTWLWVPGTDVHQLAINGAHTDSPGAGTAMPSPGYRRREKFFPGKQKRRTAWIAAFVALVMAAVFTTAIAVSQHFGAASPSTSPIHPSPPRSTSGVPAAALPSPFASSVLRGAAGLVRVVAFSADGRTVAASADNGVTVWDIRTQQVTRTVGDATPGPYQVAITSDGQYLVTNQGRNSVQLQELQTGKITRTWTGPPGSSLMSLTSDPAEPLVAAAFGNRSLMIWNSDTGQLVHKLTGLQDQVYKMAFSADGHTLATNGGERDNFVTLWDVASGQRKGQIDGVVTVNGIGVYGLAISRSGNRVAVGGNKGGVHIFSVADKQDISTFTTVSNAATSVAFSPDGQTIAFGDTASTGLANASSVGMRRLLEGADFCGYSVVFSPDGKTLATGCQDGTVRLWNLAR
jgi:FOG: WD40 repeat